MKLANDLKRYGIALVLLGSFLYVLVFGFYDTIIAKLFEFAMGSFAMVLGIWCIYLAGVQHERVLREQERRRFRLMHGTGRERMAGNAL